MASRRTPDSTPASPTTKPAAARKAAAKPAPVTTPPVAATEVTAPAKPAPAKEASASKTKASRSAAPTRVVTPDMRRAMIAEAAYLRAERRGFAQGNEEEDWLAAEAEVDKLLSADSRAPQ